MKKRIFFALLLVGAAWMAGRFVTGGGDNDTAADVAARGEIHETFELAAGASVEVRGINGPVTVETSETTTGEVHVTRAARDPGDSVEQKILIEHTPSSLSVRGENSVGGRGFLRWLFGGGGGRTGETRVTLRLPRRVDFDVRGVNGAVTVGETEGLLAVDGVNGRVEAKQAEGQARVTGTNGGVQLTFARVSQKGVEVSGVNGNVTFRLGAEAAADVDVLGLNGRANVSVSGASVEREQHGARVRAKIGAGGPRVEVKGVNGNVNFDPAN
jgi:hypothetical protein